MTTPFPRLMLILAGLASISSAEDISALRSSLLAELTARAANRHPARARDPMCIWCWKRRSATTAPRSATPASSRASSWETAELSLSKRGGAWIVQGVGGFSVGLSDRFVLHGVDTQGLTCADGRLGGSLGLSSSRYRHREDMHGTVRVPPPATGGDAGAGLEPGRRVSYPSHMRRPSVSISRPMPAKRGCWNST